MQVTLTNEAPVMVRLTVEEAVQLHDLLAYAQVASRTLELRGRVFVNAADDKLIDALTDALVNAIDAINAR